MKNIILKISNKVNQGKKNLKKRNKIIIDLNNLIKYY